MTQIYIRGTCQPSFEPVRTAFKRDLSEHVEVGARVSVLCDGETMVDLWGGHANEARDSEWAEDTLSAPPAAVPAPSPMLSMEFPPFTPRTCSLPATASAMSSASWLMRCMALYACLG